MAVVLPNASMRTRTQAVSGERDRNGRLVGSAQVTEWGPAHPGAFKEFISSDDDQGGVWNLRLDPAHWPLKPGDHVTDDDGVRVWAVRTALLHAIPNFSDVDYIQVTALLDRPTVKP